jgi:hypothetical protein
MIGAYIWPWYVLIESSLNIYIEAPSCKYYIKYLDYWISREADILDDRFNKAHKPFTTKSSPIRSKETRELFK